MKEQYPDKNILVTCMDESRFGLLPVIRKTWSKCGTRPILPVHQRYEWVYLFSVVEPNSGETFSMIWDTVRLDVMQCFIEEYSKVLEEDTICLMVMDGAGWHNEVSLDFPSNIIPLKQPPYSPECNPSERLWSWIKERLCNELFVCIEDLKIRLSEIVDQLEVCKDEIKSLTNFWWWKKSLI